MKVLDVDNKEEEVVVSVIDGGYGISEKEQENLFKKFSVLSSQTTGGETTLGLGLFNANWMAKNIGATLKYENENGSAFRFTLPKTRLA